MGIQIYFKLKFTIVIQAYREVDKYKDTDNQMDRYIFQKFCDFLRLRPDRCTDQADAYV